MITIPPRTPTVSTSLPAEAMAVTAVAKAKTKLLTVDMAKSAIFFTNLTKQMLLNRHHGFYRRVSYPAPLYCQHPITHIPVETSETLSNEMSFPDLVAILCFAVG